MLMVLAVHIDGASLGLPELSSFEALSARDVWQLSVESFAIIGVNCFTMISGYFGIRLRMRSLLVYLSQCAFYAVGLYTLFGILFPAYFSWHSWLESWLVLTHTDLWYVPAYFILMLLSPFLNAVVEFLTKKQFSYPLAAFVLLNVWCGWWWGGAFNPTGYTVMQLVMVYLIGRYVGRHVNIAASSKSSVAAASAILYFIATALIFASYLWLPEKAFAYNSPFVLMSTVSFFVFFTCFDFKSKPINYVAKSAFAVYLLHKAPLEWGNVIKPSVCRMWEGMDLAEFTLAALAMMVVIYLISMAVDAVRRMLTDRLLR